MESMTSLIAITEKEVGARHEQCVNGRELHAFLEVGKVFPAWIRERIADYRFQEDQDYMVFTEAGEKSNENQEDGIISEFGNKSGRGRPFIEYSLTLDMAKELCMIERNEKGRQARKYFIECEKRVKAMRTADEGIFATGLRTGIALNRVLQRNGFDLADVARLVWYRKNELTQEEAAKIFEMSKDRIKEIEKTLKTAGVELPAIHGLRRSREMRNLLDDMLGFEDKGLKLLQGGAL